MCHGWYDERFEERRSARRFRDLFAREERAEDAPRPVVDDEPEREPEPEPVAERVPLTTA